MKKVLKMNFKTSEGKTSTITVQNPLEDLTKEVVFAAMQKIVDAAAFVKDEVIIYAKVDNAKYYITQSDELFDLEDHETELPAA